MVLGSVFVGVSVWLGWNGIRVAACNTDTTPPQPYRNSDTHRTKNNTTNVVIQQNSRKLLMMDILMSETCWAHKKWNKIASDIKLVLYSSIRFNSIAHIALWRFRRKCGLYPKNICLSMQRIQGKYEYKFWGCIEHFLVKIIEGNILSHQEHM